ncbi:MAG: hypothetical protein CL670_02425 [Balneola sp.]|jgi:uncharacterized membrane protein (DUF2068 family)|nr:hypothetical protein [Balneola sp.]MBE77991.1 hypothetical protein [Balneola sp.]HBX65630.1 hypothetical protein [Balneolaceae bacterium]|tara:strand:- start:152 stop:550 length:399 start_codon:yes stop_codon:yes gene_type:complete
MNVKDRRIHLFLQLFFLLIGLYQFVRLIGSLQSGQFSGNLFEFQSNNLPALSIASALTVGFTSLISSFSMWTRAAWTYGFTLFTSGILFAYHLMNLGSAILHNSYEIIPIVIVLVVVLQSFPFLLRRSYRSV